MSNYVINPITLRWRAVDMSQAVRDIQSELARSPFRDRSAPTDAALHLYLATALRWMEAIYRDYPMTEFQERVVGKLEQIVSLTLAHYHPAEVGVFWTLLIYLSQTLLGVDLKEYRYVLLAERDLSLASARLATDENTQEWVIYDSSDTELCRGGGLDWLMQAVDQVRVDAVFTRTVWQGKDDV